MGVIRSNTRAPQPVSVEIAEKITLTAIGAININVPLIVNHVDFFPSSFKLDIWGKVLYFDPVLVDEEPPADLILITHSHQDHFSVPDINKLLKADTIIFCPEKLHKKLSQLLTGCTVKEIKPGNTATFEDITIEAIGAYNLKSGLFTPHPKAAKNVGYIVEHGAVRIYHAGDTDVTPEMEELKNITAVLTPIDGGNLTMSTEHAAAFINQLKPQFAIPMHYNIGTDEVEKLKKLVDRETKVVIMDGQKG